MTIETIDNWTGHSYLASRCFAPLAKSSTLAVIATQEEEDAAPVAARVVFARKAEDATYQLDEEYWNNAATGVLYMRFGSVTVADNDEGAAMID
jgi:hypothetical protein